MFKAHPGRSMTSLVKMLSIGTKVYVCVCHIKIFARWQRDKMVSISAATLEDKHLKITGMSGIQNGIFSVNTVSRQA